MVFYWFAHHMEGDNGQDIGAHPNFGFLSSLVFGVFVRCVCPGRRRDPPPQSLQEEPSGNSASDPGASWHRHQR